VNNHQLRNIGKHESNSLQRELIKDVKLHDLVDKRMIEVDRRSVEQLYQKQSDYDTVDYISHSFAINISTKYQTTTN
jgi:hypothetical protein